MSDVDTNMPGLTISSPLFFRSDESIDYETLGRYLDDVCVNVHVSAVYAMAYNTRYRMLGPNELLDVNKFIIQKVKEYGHKVYVGHPYTFNKHSLEKYLSEIKEEKPDGISMLYPERYFGINTPIIEFLRFPLNYGLNVVLHEMKLVSGFDGELINWPASLLEEVFNSVPLSAIKEDSKDDQITEKVLELCHKHEVTCIVAGGGKLRASRFFEKGLRTWLNGSTMFVPSLIDKIYVALVESDQSYIDWYMANIEKPFFQNVVSNLGWHLAHKVALEYFGYGERYERFPHANVGEQEVTRANSHLEAIKQSILNGYAE